MQDVDAFSEEDGRENENLNNQQVSISMTWHSLIARVKIQDFLNWRFQKLWYFAFPIWCYRFLLPSVKWTQFWTQYRVNSERFLSWLWQIVWKKWTFLRDRIQLYFKVKSCLGYILLTTVLKSFGSDFPLMCSVLIC